MTDYRITNEQDNPYAGDFFSAAQVAEIIERELDHDHTRVWEIEHNGEFTHLTAVYVAVLDAPRRPIVAIWSDKVGVLRRAIDVPGCFDLLVYRDGELIGTRLVTGAWKPAA